MIKNWNEMDLSHYKRLFEIIRKDWENELDMNLAMVSVLSDIPIEDITNMEVNKLQEFINNLKFIETPYKPKTPETTYNIGNKEYKVFFNVNKMTASQYIDFQNFYKQYDDFMPNLAACFLLPNGKKYGEDYDPIDEAEFLNTHLTIDIFSDIMFFFVNLLQVSTLSTLHSSEREMKKRLRKTKDKLERRKLLKSLIQTRRLILLLKNEAELSE
jgi:hypothetical protein|nr:MAG TPA: hypothetical protein [Bacteriophage sp.]